MEKKSGSRCDLRGIQDIEHVGLVGPEICICVFA